MLKIRLQRTGRRNDPAFRMVVAEHTVGPQSGKIVEKLGSYHPKTKDTILNAERIKYWLSVGAKASDRVHNMLISAGIIEGKKINVLPKKSPVVKEVEEEKEVKAEDASEDGEETVEESASAEDTTNEEGKDENKEEQPAEEDKKEEKTEETPAAEETKEEAGDKKEE